MNATRAHTLASLILILAALIWGVSFVVMKNTLDAIPVNMILAIRFTIGALGLSFALFKYRSDLSLKIVLYGAITGFLLYGGFVFQTYGLQYTTVGKNAFITAAYVVLVPIFAWVLFRKKPRLIMLLAAMICFVGLGLISLDGETGAAAEKSLSILGTSLTGRSLELFGDALTLLSGIFFALHIVFVDRFTEKGANVLALTCLQFAFAGLYSWINTLSTERMPDFSALSTDVWLSLAYISLLATLLALTLQNIGIKKASPAYASLLLCLEAPFGSLSAIILLSERPSVMTICGFVVICAAMVLAQIRPRQSRQIGNNSSATP